MNEPYYSALQDLNSLLLSNPGKIHFLFRLLVNQLIFFSCLLTARNEEALEAARETAELYGIATGGLEHDLSNRWRQIPREFHRYIQDKKELSYMIQSWEAEL